jgi:hypothetical protein
MDHQHALGTQPHQDLGHRAAQCLGINADQQSLDAGRVGHRTEDVENCPQTHLATGPDRMAHGAVVGGSKHEAHADFLDARHYLRRLQIQGNPRSLEHVGAARTGGYRSIAVLRYAPTRGRDHETGCGGYVEQVGTIAAGADDIYQFFAGNIDHTRQAAHDHHGPGYFIQGLAFHAYAHQEGADLCVAGRASHDLAHHVLHFRQREILTVGDSCQRCLDIHAPRSAQ